MNLRIRNLESHGFEFICVDVDLNTFKSKDLLEQIEKQFQIKFPLHSIIFESTDKDGMRHYEGDEDVCKALRSKPEIRSSPWRNYILDL